MQDTLVGKKFGNLVVQKLAYRGKDSKKYWECQCGCGRVCLVQESHLKNGHTKSCGCLRMIIPGLFEPPVRTLRATIPENESHIFR